MERRLAHHSSNLRDLSALRGKNFLVEVTYATCLSIGFLET
jgi:hypothetical protein